MKGKKHKRQNKHIMRIIDKIRQKRFGMVKNLWQRLNKELLEKQQKERVKKNRLSSERYRANLERGFSYSDKPKKERKDNKKEINRGSGYGSGKSKMFCVKCKYVSNHFHSKCPNCQSTKTISLGSSVRVPKKKAGKNTWKNFYNNFVNPILNN